MKNELGELLKKLRGYNSLRTIAEKTNNKISFSHLNNIEKGIHPRTGQPLIPSPEILKTLAEVYEYPYEELMKLAGYLEKENKLEKLINDFNSLSKDEKQIFLDKILDK